MSGSSAAFMGKPDCNKHPKNYPAVPAKTPTTTVKIQGQWALKVDDEYPDHADASVPPGPVHAGVTISAGSSKVFINGMPAARIGDPLSCGALIPAGSDKVRFA